MTSAAGNVSYLADRSSRAAHPSMQPSREPVEPLVVITLTQAQQIASIVQCPTVHSDAAREAAVDEIYRLRRALAYEARVVEAHYEGLKSFPKSRRPIAEAQVARMRLAAWSPAVAYADVGWGHAQRELARLHGDARDHLTSGSWHADLMAVADATKATK